MLQFKKILKSMRTQSVEEMILDLNPFEDNYYLARFAILRTISESIHMCCLKATQATSDVDLPEYFIVFDKMPESKIFKPTLDSQIIEMFPTIQSYYLKLWETGLNPNYSKEELHVFLKKMLTELNHLPPEKKSKIEYLEETHLTDLIRKITENQPLFEFANAEDRIQ